MEVGWEVTRDSDEQDGGGAKLILDWQEVSGPPVSPPERPGFGTRLIALSASNDLGGTAEQRFEPTGLVARIEVPLT